MFKNAKQMVSECQSNYHVLQVVLTVFVSRGFSSPKNGNMGTCSFFSGPMMLFQARNGLVNHVTICDESTSFLGPVSMAVSRAPRIGFSLRGIGQKHHRFKSLLN